MLVLHGFMASGQCDLAITDFNFITGDLVVEVINSENCGVKTDHKSKIILIYQY